MSDLPIPASESAARPGLPSPSVSQIRVSCRINGLAGHSRFSLVCLTGSPPEGVLDHLAHHGGQGALVEAIDLAPYAVGHELAEARRRRHRRGDAELQMEMREGVAHQPLAHLPARRYRRLVERLCEVERG